MLSLRVSKKSKCAFGKTNDSTFECLFLHLTSHAIYGVQVITFVNTSASDQWLDVLTPSKMDNGKVLGWFQTHTIVPSGSVLSPSTRSQSFPSVYEDDSPSALRIVNHFWVTDQISTFSFRTYPSNISCHIAPDSKIDCSALDTP